MKKLTVLFAVLALFAGLANAQCVKTEDSSGTQCFTLYAGQTIDAGTVCVSVVGDNLEVTYTTTNGWTLNETHMWVGTDVADMPQTRKGSPIPGQFPHVSGDISGATSYTSSAPLSTLGFSCPSADETMLMAAHAAVSRDNGDGTTQSETGWSDGGRITEKGNWATLSSFVLTCDCGNGGGGGGGECETAFAFGGELATCFLSIDEDGDNVGDFSRWGWTNGALAEGTYVLDIYAGAGQCDTSKGTFVGTLTVDYYGGTADVSYDMIAGYNLEETHLFVGDEILPRNNQGFFTVAPGQYPTIHESLDGASSDSYSVGASGDVHVVAHAVVCGF